jgi:hypothetical protein
MFACEGDIQNNSMTMFIGLHRGMRMLPQVQRAHAILVQRRWLRGVITLFTRLQLWSSERKYVERTRSMTDEPETVLEDIFILINLIPLDLSNLDSGIEHFRRYCASFGALILGKYNLQYMVNLSRFLPLFSRFSQLENLISHGSP